MAEDVSKDRSQQDGTELHLLRKRHNVQSLLCHYQGSHSWAGIIIPSLNPLARAFIAVDARSLSLRECLKGRGLAANSNGTSRHANLHLSWHPYLGAIFLVCCSPGAADTFARGCSRLNERCKWCKQVFMCGHRPRQSNVESLPGLPSSITSTEPASANNTFHPAGKNRPFLPHILSTRHGFS